MRANFYRVAERMNQTIQERIVSMLHHSGLSMVSRLSRYSRPCTLSICHRVGLLDRKFRKSFGHGENRITISCRFLDAMRTYLCRRTSIINLSHGHGNAFSLVTDLTEVSAIDYGTRRLTKLSEVRTWSSTSLRCTSPPNARSKYGELRFRTYLLLWIAQHSVRGRLHGQTILLVRKEPYLKIIRVAVLLSVRQARRNHVRTCEVRSH
jgi:hypothetical protein